MNFITESSSKIARLCALTMLVTLVACGGGGGGGSTAVSAAPAAVVATSPGGTSGTLSVPVPVVETLASSIVAVASVGSYTATSEELAAFNLLNAERLSCGFGSLAQNAQLDAAAKAHNDYQLINNLDSHNENSALYPIGFTGVNSAARVLAQGYTGAGATGDEYAYLPGKTSKSGVAIGAIRGLLAAPYHLSGLMNGYRDVGISVRSSVDVGSSNPAVFTHINLAYKTTAGQQLLAGGDVKTYPCDGTTGVDRQLKNETPNPVPGRDLFINPLGTPVYIQVRDGNVLTISNATMTQLSNGLPVTLRSAITSANDPNNAFKANQAYLIPDGPVAANNSFQVTINGTNNGVAFSRTFTFTTGSGG